MDNASRELIRGFFATIGVCSVDLWKVAVHTSSEAADAVVDLLMAHGAVATDAVDRWDVEDKRRHLQFGELLDEAFIDAPSDGAVVSGYLERDRYSAEELAAWVEALRSELAQLRDFGLTPGSLVVETSALAEAEYLHAWKRDYRALAVSDRLAIVPLWERDTWAGAAGQAAIYVEPGVAFGTGTHETTRLCLLELEEAVAPGVSVLDVGTGTGILAMAAAKLGTRRVLAVDLDDVAVRVAKDNVAANGVTGVVEVIESDLAAKVGDERFDVAVANLLAGLVIQLAPNIGRHLRRGGVLIASGIVLKQADDVQAALVAHGFCVERVRQEADWVAIRARWEG